ncbi:DUF3040 domain-containing protein [Streptomyces sp. 8K308]|uniref:DUF3040 domain-containing protein n=1 Tax=Streptomyces sp. 8K308 TaxID=2530388 RepID=UPI001050948E|nr:DUF3040 domain-containing protein [Streptomyces sp. 8K308]TDC07942.1 DUF3040 domain-containing protein [Streptomyces sp. 8K308]
MPLSDHEQRMLEQMERALYAEDPKFASSLEGNELRTYTRKRVYQAIAGFVVGIGLLMGGMVAQLIWLSVVGFLIMLGCAVVAVTGWRRTPPQGDARGGRRGGSGGGQAGSRQRRSMMNRIEERWQRRREERDD